jgi:fumarate reductase flavoprotein subunit
MEQIQVQLQNKKRKDDKMENKKRKKCWQITIFTFLLGLMLCFPANAERVLNADIVIVGAGAAGTAAGLEAVLSGAKVIMLEKQKITGGTANFSEGPFAAESKLQARVGIVVTKDFAFKYMMDYSHWLANPRLVRAFVNKSAETIDWLMAQGVKFEFVGATNPGGPMTWHVVQGLGKNLMKILQEKYQAAGGQVLLETPGKSLIKENGRVVGVIATNKSGETIRVQAKAVIVATGGYANNKEMLQKYFPAFPEIIPIGNIGKDGDGIKMAWAAGAAKEGLGVMQTYRLGVPGYGLASHLNAAYSQPVLFVDKKGRRFMDESLSTNWPFAGNAGIKAGGIAYSIFDAAILESYKKVGIPVPAGGQYTPAWTKLTKFDEEFKKELESNRGYVFIADSIQDLARQLSMDPQVLIATIEENNHYAKMHIDPLFGKDGKFMRVISQPPFYAVKIQPRSLGTLGGVKINEKIEAVDENGDPIPGLYVAGSDAGGLYGDTYDLMMAGSTLGFALNSGRIAAENALKYIKTMSK